MSAVIHCHHEPSQLVAQCQGVYEFQKAHDASPCFSINADMKTQPTHFYRPSPLLLPAVILPVLTVPSHPGALI